MLKAVYMLVRNIINILTDVVNVEGWRGGLNVDVNVCLDVE